mgnify:FL=1
MMNGVIRFSRPEDCKVSKLIREMPVKKFERGQNLLDVEKEEPLSLEDMT